MEEKKNKILSSIKTASGRQKFWVIFAAFVLLTLAIKLVSYLPAEEHLLLGDVPVSLLKADTPTEMFRGLGGRTDLGSFDGMIFLFPYAGQHGIVMRDMNFPIDIVWLNKGTVVHYEKNAPTEPGVPELELKAYYPPEEVEATTVIELRAGWIEENGLKLGDVLTRKHK